MAKKAQATVDVTDLDYASQDFHVLREVSRILDDGRKPYLAGDPKLKPAKLSQLAMDGIRPLRWDDLSDKQQKALDLILPIRQPYSLVRFGDAVIVVGDEAAWAKRQRRKDAFKRAEESSKVEATSTQTLSREIGIQVSDR